MLTSAAVLGVLAVALAMVLTPGPNMMYLVSRTVTQGRRAGLISLGGIALGFLVYLIATNLGLSALFTAVPDLYLTIKLAGACYLGWLAFKALRPGGVSIFTPARLSHDSGRRLFTMGLMTALLNPKIAVMYLSLDSPVRATSRRPLSAAGVHAWRAPDPRVAHGQFLHRAGRRDHREGSQRATSLGSCAALCDGYRARRARGEAADRPRSPESGLATAARSALGRHRVGQRRNHLVGVGLQGGLFCVVLQVDRELVDTERL